MPPRNRSAKAKPKSGGRITREKWIAILSAAILVLTYTIQEVLKDRAKDVSTSVQSAEALYRTESGQSTLSTQVLTLQITEVRKQISSLPTDPNRDYSSEIRESLGLLQQVRAELKSSLESVTRLVKKLPSHSDLQREVDQLRPGVEQVNREADDVLKPSMHWKNGATGRTIRRAGRISMP